MSATLPPYADIGEAIRKVNALVKRAKELGFDVLRADVGAHLNPGDVYDAYEAIGRKPVAADALEADQCGPFTAVFLHQHPDADPETWRNEITRTYDARYVEGFYHGFRLEIPEPETEVELHFLRGVYDGVMSNAAVF